MAGQLVIVYDGACRFCVRQMNWIRSRDRNGSFDFVPSTTANLLDRYPILASQDLNTGLRAIRPDGSVFIGADAVYEIAGRLPYWRRWIWLYRVPGLGVVWRRLYAWIAARRYALAGKCDSSCAVTLSAQSRKS